MIKHDISINNNQSVRSNTKSIKTKEFDGKKESEYLGNSKYFCSLDPFYTVPKLFNSLKEFRNSSIRHKEIEEQCMAEIEAYSIEIRTNLEKLNYKFHDLKK